MLTLQCHHSEGRRRARAGACGSAGVEGARAWGGGSAEEVGRGMEEGKGHGWGGGEQGAFQLNASLTLDRLSRPFPIDKNTTGCKKKVITLINLYACTT